MPRYLVGHFYVRSEQKLECTQLKWNLVANILNSILK